MRTHDISYTGSKFCGCRNLTFYKNASRLQLPYRSCLSYCFVHVSNSISFLANYIILFKGKTEKINPLAAYCFIPLKKKCNCNCNQSVPTCLLTHQVFTCCQWDEADLEAISMIIYTPFEHKQVSMKYIFLT